MKADICALERHQNITPTLAYSHLSGQTIIIVRVYNTLMSHRPPSDHKLIWHVCVCVRASTVSPLTCIDRHTHLP